MLDAHLRGRRTGARADISVTSFARGHAITAAGNGGMVGVDDEELLDLCLMLRRWGRRSETYLFGSRKGEREHFGPLADGTPYDLTFLFDRIGYNFEPSEIGAAYGLVQLEKLADYNGRRKSHWQRLDGLFEHYTEIVERPRTTEGADTVWMRYPFLLARRHRPQHGAARVAGAGHHEPDGVERQHPAPPRLRGHRAPRARRPACRTATGSPTERCRCPSHHALSSDDLGRMMSIVGEVFDDVAKSPAVTRLRNAVVVVCATDETEWSARGPAHRTYRHPDRRRGPGRRPRAWPVARTAWPRRVGAVEPVVARARHLSARRLRRRGRDRRRPRGVGLRRLRRPHHRRHPCRASGIGRCSTTVCRTARRRPTSVPVPIV